MGLASLSINWTTALRFRAHVHKTWEAIRCINFGLDDSGFEADDGAGVDFGEHRPSLCKTEGKGKFSSVGL
jgi:hypothetical protein